MSTRQPNDKQKRFCDEYLIDLNATQAAIRAGYSKNRASELGYQLLHNPTVKRYIEKRQKAMQERTEITQDDVIRELAKIGFADIRKAVKWRHNEFSDDEMTPSNSVELIGSDDIDDNTSAAIAEISQTNAGVKVKLHDKRQALVDIGRHLGMFTDKLQLNVESPATELERLKQLALKAQDKEK